METQGQQGISEKMSQGTRGEVVFQYREFPMRKKADGKKTSSPSTHSMLQQHQILFPSTKYTMLINNSTYFGGVKKYSSSMSPYVKNSTCQSVQDQITTSTVKYS